MGDINQPVIPPDNAIQLTVFDGGKVVTQGVRFLNAQGAEEKRAMADPNHCYLIHHPRGLLMWDSGLADSISALPGHCRVSGRFRFEVINPLQAQLAASGVHPEQVSWLAFSHLQVDHAGNAGLFPQARVLLQAEEYALAFSSEAEDWGYVPAEYTPLKEQEIIQLQGDFDVFGDGRVVILRAPGHTPGHQVLYVDLPEGPVLLSGDLYYAAKDPLEGWLPAWNYDKDQTRASMARLEQYAREHGAHWVINHQPKA